MVGFFQKKNQKFEFIKKIPSIQIRFLKKKIN